MLRHLIAAGVGLALVAGIVLADEYKGVVKSVDKDKNAITITVDDKDVTLTVAADAKIVKTNKKGEEKDIKTGLKGVEKDRNVTITTDKKTEKVDDKDVTTETVNKIVVGTKKKP